MKCRCGAKAVAEFRGRRLCRDCFVEAFEKSVEKFSNKWRLLEEGDRILVAVSGGKDSAALASVIKGLAEKNDAEAEMLYIDLGISSYSDPMRKASERLAEFLGMKLNIVNASSVIGEGIAEAGRKRGRKECSVCGAVKRYAMNRFAYDNHFTKIATGHNRDDIVSFFIKTLPNPQPFPPYSPWNATAVARIRPLMEVGEKDAMNYCLLKGLPFSMLECPLADEQRVKHAMAGLESSMPGIRDRIVRFIEEWSMERLRPGRIAENNYNTGRIVPCRECGMPSLSGLCIICKWRSGERGK